VPMELGRIISALGHATEKRGKDKNKTKDNKDHSKTGGRQEEKDSVKQIRCYVESATQVNKSGKYKDS